MQFAISFIMGLSGVMSGIQSDVQCFTKVQKWSNKPVFLKGNKNRISISWITLPRLHESSAAYLPRIPGNHGNCI